MKKYSAYLGMLAGVLAIVFAIVMFVGCGKVSDISLPTDTGTYTSYEYYGGDAYTGMQQASADAARNVKDQSYIILAGVRRVSAMMPTYSIGLGAVLLCMGLGMIAYFGGKLAETKDREAFEQKLLGALTPACKPEMPACEPATTEPQPEETPAEETSTEEAPAEEPAAEA